MVTLWSDAGIPLERIGDYVGHRPAGITNRYRHLSDPRRAADVALVNAYLANVRGEYAEALER